MTHTPGIRITRELVRDPVELIFEDGRHYATQRWITKTDDWRKIGAMWCNFGFIDIGPAFPTEDSVPFPTYEPPQRPRWRFWGKS